MILLIASLYLPVGLVVAALAPAVIDALTGADKVANRDETRLGLIAMLWPVAVLVCALVVLVRSVGYLGAKLPVWLGNSARWVRTQSTQWTTTKGTPTNENNNDDNRPS